MGLKIKQARWLLKRYDRSLRGQQEDFTDRLPKKSENWQLNPFYFILLDSPIIGRVTATAWRQLLRARNSPSPHER